MRKLLLVMAVVLAVGCKEKYPDQFTNDLPFGLKYYISQKEAKTILDSLAGKDTRYDYRQSNPSWCEYKYIFELPIN